MQLKRLLHTTAAITAAVLSANSFAQVPPLRFIDPGNTGIPGELVSEVTVSTAGKVWVGARWLTPAAGGLGILEPSDRTWRTFPQRDTPLPSQFVNDIEFAPDGTAWMGVTGGLAHFDAAADQWQIFDSANSPLDIGDIGDVAIADDGSIWLIDSNPNVGGDAVWRLAGLTWTDFRVGAALPVEWQPPFTDLDNIAIDAAGHVWVTNTTLFGVAEYDGIQWTLHGFDVANFDKLVFDTSGNLWLREDPIGGASGFWKFDGTDFEFFPVTNGAGDIAADDDGTVYFADVNSNLFRTDDGGATVTTLLTGLSQITEIATDPRSTDLWLGTVGAVGHFRADGTLVRDYNTFNTGVPWWLIDNFHTDAIDRLWMLSDTAGASVLEPNGEWRNWGQRNAGAEIYPFGDTTPVVNDILLSSGDQWWMVSNSGTARSPDLENWTLFAGGALELAQTPDGRIWRGGSGVLEFFEGGSWNTFPGLCPLCDVRQMSVGALGALWVISRLAVHRIVGDTLTTFVEGSDIPIDPNTTYNAVAADPDQGVWIASSNGLIRFDGTQFSVFDEENSGIVNSRVDDVAVRDDGLVAASAFVFGQIDGGVSLFDGQSFTNITPQNSALPTEQTFALHFAPDGDLLIGTGGLFGVTIADLPPGEIVFKNGFESAPGSAFSAESTAVMAE